MFKWRNDKIFNLFLSYFGTFLAVIATMSCSKNSKDISLDNKDFAEFIKGVPTIVIDIDKTDEESVEPFKIIDENSIISENPANKLLVQPATCISVNDSLFIADSKLNSILNVLIDGKFIKRIGAKGKGPGEFQEPFYISHTKDLFIVQDVANHRIQIFDRDFHYLTEIPFLHTPFTSSISMNSEQLLVLGNNLNEFYVYNLRDMKDKKAVISRKITFPLYYNNKSMYYYNTMKLSCADDFLCLYFMNQPFILLTDLLGKPFLQIKFTGHAIKKFEEYIKNNTERAIHILIQSVALSEKNIIIAMGRSLLLLQKHGNTYKLKNNFSVDNNYSVSEISVGQSTIYTCQWSKARVLLFKYH